MGESYPTIGEGQTTIGEHLQQLSDPHPFCFN